jgi:hypothetical protein
MTNKTSIPMAATIGQLQYSFKSRFASDCVSTNPLMPCQNDLDVWQLIILGPRAH